MALTIGELTGLITLDDGQVDPALRRTEGAMRASGQRLGDDAERAGQAAGQRLGEGITQGADGRFRDVRGRFVTQANALVPAARTAGQNAGDALGDGLTTTTTNGADDAVNAGESRLSRLKVAAAGIGVAAGAVLMDGLMQALEQGQITARLGAQLGTTPAVAKRYGEVAGSMYADAVTADFQTAADAISATMRAGLLPPEATNAQIESISTKVADLASTFELDLGQTANAVGQMIKSGLAKDATEAIDTVTRGLQVMGPRADDIADTFNEYSTIFRNMGLDAQTATGLMSQGMKAGARDTDVVADSIKEFSIEAVAGGERVKEGFKSLGMNADDMVKKFAAGGPTAAKAFDDVLDKLRGIEDPAKRNAVAIELFGTKAEDMGEALFALDPSKAVSDLGAVGGAAEEMGDSLRDNAGAKVEAFKRQAMQALVEFIGGEVIPALSALFGFVRDHSGEFKLAAVIITSVVVPALLLLAGRAMWAGMQMAAAWVMALGPIGWIGLAIAGLVVLVITYWDQIKSATLTAWAWVKDAVGTAVDGVLAAVSWLAGLPEMVGGWFTSMKDAAIAKATELVMWLAGLPGRVGAALGTLVSVLVGRATSAFNSFKNAAVQRATSLVDWIRGLPGRIVRGLGNLGSLLVSKGKDIIRGLWNGIKSMGSWLKNSLINFAKNLIPAPIAKVLGISSPSKVMADQVGRWIPAGIVKGIESGQGAVDRTMAGLVSVPAPGQIGMSAGGVVSGRSGSGVQVVQLESSGSELDEWFLGRLRKIVRTRGGNVQFVVGA